MENIVTQKHNGFIAITSLLLISSITFIIAISISLLGIEEAKTSLSHKKGLETFMIGQTCTEEALLRLRDDNDYAGTLNPLNVGNGSCTINITGTYPNYVIVAESVISGPPEYRKKIEVTAKKTGKSINLINWKEIE